MNSILLRSVMRQRNARFMPMAVRGAFHKPDPLPYAEYKNTRKLHLEDVNTVLYSDIGPEFHMHLHSIQI